MYVKIIVLLFWNVFIEIGFLVVLIGVDFFVFLGILVGKVNYICMYLYVFDL